MRARRRLVAGLLLLAAGAGWWAAGGGATFRGLAASLALGAAGVAILLGRVPRVLALAVAAAGGAAAVFLSLSLHEDLRGERPYVGPGTERARPSAGLGAAPAAGGPAAFPSPGKEPLRLLVWGDCRGGVTVFDRVLDAVRTRRPHATLGLGDFVGMARVHAFEILRDRLAATGVPAFLVPGNHDLDPYGTLGPYGEVLGPAGWAFLARDVLVVGLDSARGVLEAAEADRLERVVAEAGDAARHLVVCVHHPLWAPPRRPDKPLPQEDPATKRVQSVCESRGALVLCSHWHGFDRTTFRNATQVVTGGAGSRLEADDPYHYLWVEIGDDGPRVERVDVAPGDLDTARVDRLATFRDEAAWAARAMPLRAAGPWGALVAALGGLLSSLLPRRESR